jgi:hypothetical protein
VFLLESRFRVKCYSRTKAPATLVTVIVNASSPRGNLNKAYINAIVREDPRED